MTLRPLLFLLLALAAPAAAQDAPAPNLASQGRGAPSGVARIAFAHQLYALGMQNKDALTMLNAARLASAVTFVDSLRAKQTTGASAEFTTPALLSAAQMFDAAADLSAQDEALLDFVDASKREATFTPMLSAVSSASSLAPAQSDVWSVSFFGGSLAELAILGEQTGSVNLRVTDENENLVCIGTAASVAAYCSFYPADNGMFLITVTNSSAAPTAYLLLTN